MVPTSSFVCASYQYFIFMKAILDEAGVCTVDYWTKLQACALLGQKAKVTLYDGVCFQRKLNF